MLKIEKVETVGWEAATRGMRNPMNSWKKSDSFFCGSPECCFTDDECNPGCAGHGQGFNLGEADFDLMAQKEAGVILLPPYLDAQIVPDYIEIRFANGNDECVLIPTKN